MTKEELWNEAKVRVDAFIDNLSQDIRGTLYDRLNQEDVKDFLYGLYIDSAEPREKRIEKLEQKLEQTEKDLADYQFNYPSIKKLEKENAELKEQNNHLYNDLTMTEAENAGQKDQLAKAKEIMHRLLVTLKDHKWWSYHVIDEAEQFLKGENIILEDAQAGNSPFDADEVFNKEMKAYPEEK